MAFTCPVCTRLMPNPFPGNPSFPILFPLASSRIYLQRLASLCNSNLILWSSSLLVFTQFHPWPFVLPVPSPWTAVSMTMISTPNSVWPAQTSCFRPVCLFFCRDLQLTVTGHSIVTDPKPTLCWNCPHTHMHTPFSFIPFWMSDIHIHPSSPLQPENWNPPSLLLPSYPSQIQTPRPSKYRPQGFTHLFSCLPDLVIVLRISLLFWSSLWGLNQASPIPPHLPVAALVQALSTSGLDPGDAFWPRLSSLWPPNCQCIIFTYFQTFWSCSLIS